MCVCVCVHECSHAHLIKQHHVRMQDLRQRLGCRRQATLRIQVVPDIFGVHNCDDAVQAEVRRRLRPGRAAE